MNIIDIINKKRLKKELNEKEINYVINSYVKEEIKDYQMSSLLMAICINGMTEEEINYLTDAMINSGEKIDLSKINGKKIDKHSTGGVGDKTTLIVAPLVASCGVNVAKMSGRGLGHTGGTIDKLEAIPNFKVKLTENQFLNQIKKINIAIVSQTNNLVPADKKIYALRDVTGTVESLPLIASSIMSKKIASGADAIVIDLKVGSGALIKNIIDAENLANIMINIGKRYQKEVVCILSNMNKPLGYNIGNSIEVEEAITALQNKGEKDLTELCIMIASYMVSLSLNINYEEAKTKVITNLENGSALNKFYEFVKYQNGEINNMKKAKYTYEVKSTLNGFITEIDAYKIGNYACSIGCGRLNKEDVIDYEAGITLNKNINDYVKTGDNLFLVYSNKELTNFDDLLKSVTISSKKIKEDKLIYKIIK